MNSPPSRKSVVRVGDIRHSWGSRPECNRYIVADITPANRVRVVYTCTCHMGIWGHHEFDIADIILDDLLIEYEDT